MKWISVEERLPEINKYVLAKHKRGTWHDDDDKKNVNCVVVKLKKGISLNDREKLSLMNHPLSKVYKAEDEHGNNLVPYAWFTFGPDYFFGQEITLWCEIPDLP